ncbi:MAG: phosphodiester glycosidase family protein [Clostridia bacterium]|nr:phosphodiester glycosidase family protein [Clostridia bacterium]
MHTHRTSRLVSLIMLTLLFSLPASWALADLTPLALDMKVHGNPPREDCWIEKGKEYRDESIHVVMETGNRKGKSSDSRVSTRWLTIEIADPSQIRTTLSFESFSDNRLTRSVNMQRSVNAIVALNDDFVKISNYRGYVMRQGVFYCDTLDEHAKAQDVLIIDDQGDFRLVLDATSASMQEYLAQMETEGRKPINVFTFGPALVIDGIAQTQFDDDKIRSPYYATPRIALCQLDHLKYAIVQIDGSSGNGLNCPELANYIVQLFPECKIAYNLDGGGSTHLFFGDKLVSKVKGSREISGMIYFASIASEE